MMNEKIFDRNLVNIGKCLWLSIGVCRSAIYDIKTGNVFWINKKLSQLFLIALKNSRKRNLIYTILKDNAIDFEQRLFKFESSKNKINIKKISLNFVWFEIESSCNNKCIHCYAWKDLNIDIQKKLDYNGWLNIIKNCYTAGAEACQFIGGEPLLYRNNGKSINDLILFTNKVGYKTIEIFSNLVNIDLLDIGIVGECVTEIKTTLHSYRPEIHDFITQNKESWQKTIRNIKILRNNNIEVSVHIIVQKENENDVYETIKFCKEVLHIERIRSDLVRPLINKDLRKLIPSFEYKKKYELKMPNFYCTKYMIENWGNYNPCLAGKIAVKENGDIIPCIFLRDKIVGNILTDNIDYILQGKKILDFWYLGKNKLMKCKDCEFRYICSDCRALSIALDYQKKTKDSLPARCSYNPYTGAWNT